MFKMVCLHSLITFTRDHPVNGTLTDPAAEKQVDFTETVDIVVLQKSIAAQIRRLILSYCHNFRTNPLTCS
jgi:hypothetical protein